jgi:hypothetical protein
MRHVSWYYEAHKRLQLLLSGTTLQASVWQVQGIKRSLSWAATLGFVSYTRIAPKTRGSKRKNETKRCFIRY